MIKQGGFSEEEISALKNTLKDHDYSRDSLEMAYLILSQIKDRGRETEKLQAEICYLLAEEIKKTDVFRAKKLAEESIGIYKKLTIQTLEESVPILWEKLPDHMHEGVVKNRLKDILQD